MVRITYGVAGFVCGIMTGLLLAALEVRLLRGRDSEDYLPFLAGASVFIMIIIGVRVGLRLARRRLRS